MNVESQTYGFLNDWHLPSPSSTPKSCGPDTTTFLTPRSEPSSSHFLDAFVTPRANGHTTPARTPQATLFSGVGRPGSSNSRCKPGDPGFYLNHFSSNPQLPLPPVSPSRRLSSSPAPSTLTRNQASLDGPLNTSEAIAAIAMDSFQMHTPPPTRDSSSRRSAQSARLEQQHTQDTPSAQFGHHFTPLMNDNGMPTGLPVMQSPFQFNDNQFSPNLYQFPGPTSANTSPLIQQQAQWGPNTNVGMDDVDMMNVTSNPFGSRPPSFPTASEWAQDSADAYKVQNPIAHKRAGTMQSDEALDFWGGASNATPQSQNTLPADASFMSTTSGVNPSLLFSFSSPTGMPSNQPIKPQFPSNVSDFDGRQPYEHQTRESLREREFAIQARNPHSRTDSSSSSASAQTIAKPSSGLRRSNTDSGFRRSRRPESQASSFTTEQTHIPRRPSPLKRNSQTFLSSIPEAARAKPRTRLVIDESGRARTETVGASPAKSGDGRTGTTDPENIDDSDSDDSIHVPSQRNSFAFSSEELRRTKHARIGSDQDRSEIFKMPRSGSSSSLSSFNIRSLRTGRNTNETRRHSMAGYTGSFSSFTENLSPTMPSVDDAGDAQLALKKVVEGRQRRQDTSSPHDIVRAHNQRWSQASNELIPHANYSPFDTTTTTTTVSPTSDALTPRTNLSSASNDSGTRCLCNSADGDGQLMIQCESCTKWLHVKCVGLNSAALPPVYVCVFCTGQTPTVRGGRVREPVRVRQGFAGASPLGYKSAGGSSGGGGGGLFGRR